MEFCFRQIEVELKNTYWADEKAIANILNKFDKVISTALILHSEINRHLVHLSKPSIINNLGIISRFKALLEKIVLIQINYNCSLELAKTKLEKKKYEEVERHDDTIQDQQDREHQVYLVQVRDAAKEVVTVIETRILSDIFFTIPQILATTMKMSEQDFVAKALDKTRGKLCYGIGFIDQDRINLDNILNEFSRDFNLLLSDQYRIHQDRECYSEVDFAKTEACIIKDMTDVIKNAIGKSIFSAMLKDGIEDVANKAIVIEPRVVGSHSMGR